jgi:tetratricopeptide (TPR) repeat protein
VRPSWHHGAAALVLLAVAATLAGCARPAPRAPQPAAEAFRRPEVRPGDATEKEERQFDKAWQLLLRGDLPRAEKDLRALSTRRPKLVAARTGLAYVQLAAGKPDEAGRLFEAVLAERPDEPSALTGAAIAAGRRGDLEAALVYYRRASEARPAEAGLRRQVADARVQLTEHRVAAAREALDRGDSAGAIAAYERALQAAPELAGLRLELAELLLKQGDTAAAVAALEADPTGERQVWLRLGEVQTGLQEYERALATYRRMLERDPRDEEALRAARLVREQIELSQMPPEYRRIRTAEVITRADLAALMAVKVSALGKVPTGAAPVAVDISGSWARDHILRLLSLGIMTVYPNHTFQPAATVRRGEMALAIQRVLDLLRHPAAPAPVFSDMSRSNLHHYAAARVVAAGLMDLTPQGAFQAWRPVSGREANDVIENLVRVVGP